MPANNLLCGLVLATIRCAVSELGGVSEFKEKAKDLKLIPLDPRDSCYTNTLILDLDETLIYSRDFKYRGEGDFWYCRECEDGRFKSFPSQLREGVIETLIALKEEGWELIIWTAGVDSYGEAIKEYLESKKHGKKEVKIAAVVGSDTSGGSAKDIRRLCDEKGSRRLGSRHLDSMLIVDNKPEYCYPSENTIGIRSWYGYNPVLPKHAEMDLQELKNQDAVPPFSDPKHGSDEGEAMRQLKYLLNNFSGRRVTVERYQISVLPWTRVSENGVLP